ncbi:MAG: hypothetical protein HKN21_16890 [Candidatus Eisenbacteria bacterium]|uniref:Uncharacterized protein n=1 Tax=Eiseniibacteriota bacterium TaxID=2212470 RepID=A0A7Y2ECE2_UNCEI|nr:hypothetical protein [Candidatus Eisenbacteria bacterium]
MNKAAECAEIVDRVYKNIAFLVLFMALSCTADALRHILPESNLQILRYVSKGFAALTVLTALRGIWLMRAKFRLGKRNTEEHESFVLDAFRKACTVSWALTMAFLALADNFVPNISPEDQVDFVVQASLAFMLGVFSIAYFIRSRSGNEGFDEDFAS